MEFLSNTKHLESLIKSTYCRPISVSSTTFMFITMELSIIITKLATIIIIAI